MLVSLFGMGKLYSLSQSWRNGKSHVPARPGWRQTLNHSPLLFIMNTDEIVIFVILFSGVIFDMLHKDRHPLGSYHMTREEFIPAGHLKPGTAHSKKTKIDQEETDWRKL